MGSAGKTERELKAAYPDGKAGDAWFPEAPTVWYSETPGKLSPRVTTSGDRIRRRREVRLD